MSEKNQTEKTEEEKAAEILANKEAEEKAKDDEKAKDKSTSKDDEKKKDDEAIGELERIKKEKEELEEKYRKLQDSLKDDEKEEAPGEDEKNKKIKKTYLTKEEAEELYKKVLDEIDEKKAIQTEQEKKLTLLKKLTNEEIKSFKEAGVDLTTASSSMIETLQNVYSQNKPKPKFHNININTNIGSGTSYTQDDFAKRGKELNKKLNKAN